MVLGLRHKALVGGKSDVEVNVDYQLQKYCVFLEWFLLKVELKNRNISVEIFHVRSIQKSIVRFNSRRGLIGSE